MRLVYVALLAAALALLPLVGPAAAEKMSCDELKTIQNNLVDFDQTLKQHGLSQIKEDGEADKALRQMVEALTMVAESENDASLSASVEDMATAWENMDGDLFVQSVTNAANSMYDIYQKDCN